MVREKEKDCFLLYVENDFDSYLLLKSSLENHPGFPYKIDRAANIKQALERLQKYSYSLLLLEAQLEDENGLELVKKMRGLGLDIPFVLMTSVQDSRLRQEALGLGASDVIVRSQKHFHEFRSRLEEVYQKPGPGRTPKKSRKRFQTMNEEAANPKDDLSIRDPLTGVYNHSHLFGRIADEFARAKRHSYPLSCLVLDIDHFKFINEKWNYRIGDALLREIAGLLLANCRLSDFISRYGGEEFAVLMPYTDYQGASELASRLQNLFAKHVFLAQSGEITEGIHLTVSLGISSFPQDLITQKSELMAFAVQALYRSKAAGRNKVTLYHDILPVFGKDELPILRISEEKVLDFQRRISEIASTARKTYLEAAKTMIMALESKDPFTAGHAASCAKYCMAIAEAMGMSIDEAEVVEHAALLHDIGKICIADDILLKTGKLTFAEFETMRQHAYLGYKMLKPLKFLDREALLVLHHHEWFNGEGYPCRLKGEEIPLGARIISVVDAYDTMRNAGGRYKKTCTVESSVNELIACAGVQFDPRIVKAFIDVLAMCGELTSQSYDKTRLEKAILDLPQETHPA